jgi:hypothetical protein
MGVKPAGKIRQPDVAQQQHMQQQVRALQLPYEFLTVQLHVCTASAGQHAAACLHPLSVQMFSLHSMCN